MSHEEGGDLTENRPSTGAFLRAIEVTDFKSVRHARVELSPLTVLVGKNSAGKSSLIESILLRAQNDRQMWWTTLQLNGEHVDIGTHPDAVREGSDEEVFRIGGEISLGLDPGGPGPDGDDLVTGTQGVAQPGLRMRREFSAFAMNTNAPPSRAARPDPRLLPTLDNALVQAELRRLRQKLVDGGGIGTEMLLRWWIEVGNADPLAESKGLPYGRVQRGRLELVGASGQELFASEVGFEPRWDDFIDHGYSFADFSTAEFDGIGELRHPAYPEPVKVVRVDSRFGLPGAVHIVQDAHRHVAGKLIRNWIWRTGSRSYRRNIRPGSTAATKVSELAEGATERMALYLAGTPTPEDAGEAEDFLRGAGEVADMRSAYAMGWLDENDISFLQGIPNWSFSEFADLEPHGPGATGLVRSASAATDDLVEQAALWVDLYLRKISEFLPRYDNNEVVYGLDTDVDRWLNEMQIGPSQDLEEATGQVEKVKAWIDQLNYEQNPAQDDVPQLEGTSGSADLIAVLREISSPAEFGHPVDSEDQLVQRVAKSTRTRIPSQLKAVEQQREINSLHRSLVRVIEKTLGDRTFLVGPLRKGPAAVYAPGVGPTRPQGPTVGRSGEFTAQVLYELQDRHVEGQVGDVFSEEEVYPLIDVLTHWVGPNGLDLVEAVRAESLGAAGYQLEVRPFGLARFVDLTSVGTGVSQVLPVVVQGLIAPRDSLLIFQQPELHLHPSLQQKLGDFMLALVKSGRQVILETQSEYIVSRLALHAAESETARDHISLKLVTRTDEEGTVYQPAEIDEYGSIQWPTGFFDETSAGAVAILMAAARRLEGTDRSADEDEPADA